MIDLFLVMAIPDEVLCPALPDDPPWRPITCYILAHMGEPPNR